MRVGAIDIGAVGDAPPVFAQAAHADLVYIAARPDSGNSSAILLPPGSSCARWPTSGASASPSGRGSSAHSLTLAALEKAGIAYRDIKPIDARTGRRGGGLRRMATSMPGRSGTPMSPSPRPGPACACWPRLRDIGPQNSFYLASRDYATRYGEVLNLVVRHLGRVGAWCDAHRAAVAQLLSSGTGISLDAWQRAADRGSFRSVPVDDTLLLQQQQ